MNNKAVSKVTRISHVEVNRSDELEREDEISPLVLEAVMLC